MTHDDLITLIGSASTMTDAEIESAARRLLAASTMSTDTLHRTGTEVIGLCAASPAEGAIAGIALLARLAGVDPSSILADAEAQMAPRLPKRSAASH